jgi:hypothetical protein
MREHNGRKVYAYRNLQSGDFSIQARGGERSGRVIANTDSLMVIGAEFWVSAAGIARVRRIGRRKVVAGVIGIVDFDAVVSSLEGWTEVTINPFDNDTFVTRTGIPVRFVSRVWFENNKTYAPTADIP